MLWLLAFPLTLLWWLLVGLWWLMVGLWWWKELTMGICRSKKKLNGKTVIVTGGNSGIGFETAKDLARRGANLVFACRSKQRGAEAVDLIKRETGNKHVTLMLLDLSDFQNIKQFVKEAYQSLDKVDILVNNAGIPPLPSSKLSQDNYDIVLQTNYFSHFYLVMQLRDLMMRSDEPRIVNVSSMACKQVREPINFSAIKKGTEYQVNVVYGVSKFMQCLFTQELARRWGKDGFLTYSLHPGAVRTEILNKSEVPPWYKTLNEQTKTVLRFLAQSIGRIYGKTSFQGAQTSIYCCVEDGLVNGEYYSDCRLGGWHMRHPQMSDPEMAAKLWEFSEQLVQHL